MKVWFAEDIDIERFTRWPYLQKYGKLSVLTIVSTCLVIQCSTRMNAREAEQVARRITRKDYEKLDLKH